MTDDTGVWPEDNFENDISAALEQEQAALTEIELEKILSRPDQAATEPPSRRKLKKELEREALLRLEDAARTEEDFQNILLWWDRLDSNRERKERYHEVGRSDVPLEWGMSAEEIIVPSPIRHRFWRQMMKGDFLDAIFNCPFELHEIVEDKNISKALFQLKDVQKELLYQLAICGYSCRQIAELRGQTDRNIRKVRNTMLKKLRRQISPAETTDHD